VRAIDQAANVDPTPANYSWIIELPDCGAPITILADADTWIDQNSASNNFGTDAILKVQAKGHNNFRTLVRFPLLAKAPPDCTLQSATLRLYAPSWTKGRTLEARQVAGSWSEDSVTWSNQPQTTGDAVTISSGKGYREWNVTTQIQAMFATGTNDGFLIRDAEERGAGEEQQFHSREKGENPPELVINFAPTGE
jgi:hypothetical protein